MSKKTKEFEIIKCECGHEVPIDFAHINIEGQWTCVNCILAELSEDGNLYHKS